MTPSAVITTAPPRRTSYAKAALWTVMALMTLSVIILSEIPLFKLTHPRHLHLVSIRWMLIPHALAGTTATLIGPLQLSTRLRSRHLTLHRILGRVYVVAILIAAPLAIYIATINHQPAIFYTGTIVQSGSWIVTTLAAFLTARNRHIQQHRQWVVRSYAVTFTFILVRVLNPVPAWYNLSDDAFGAAILVIVFLALLIPDLAFHWRELTTRRAR